MKEFMDFVVANYALIIMFVCVIVFCVQKVVTFISYPTDKKKAELKARLLIWVTEAEKELGSGTGAIKLSEVYDKFCQEFPYLKKWFTLDKFNELVNEAIKEMERVLVVKSAKENNASSTVAK